MRAVLDWLGSALAGSIEPPARIAQRIAAGFGTSGEATVFGAPRGSAAAAAFANGVASHILELDDIHKGSTVHGAAPIIPAALAVAEREHASGAAFLAAVTVGYETAFRIGEAVNPSHYRFWHPTGTVATFGAAAAAGLLVGLTPEQIAHALGTAGTQAAGLWEFNADGAMSKHLHPGKAAMNGVMAADLARAGFTGAGRILEGERGFMRAMSSADDSATDHRRPRRGLEDRGERLQAARLLRSYAQCDRSGDRPALAVRLVLGRDARAGGGGRRRDLRPGIRDCEGCEPAVALPRQVQHGLLRRRRLLEGQVGLEQFTAERFGADGVREPAIAAMLPRIRVAVAGDLTAKYPAAWPARVTLTLADGSRLCDASDYPRGNPENPISTRALEEKLVALVAPRFGSECADAALAAIAGAS